MTITSETIAHEKGQIQVFTLTNACGSQLTLTTLGATILRLLMPDKDRQLRDLVLGYDQVDDYWTNDDTYFGATVGRVANRTGGAAFAINGNTYHLTKNEGHNNLHSGPEGYQLRLWQVDKIDQEANAMTLSLHSPDGDQGYPGNLDLKVSFQLTDDNEVHIAYDAIADQDTPFSPTNHSYFNLNGHDSGDVLNHLLLIQANAITPIQDSHSITEGNYLDVEGTAFDFRQAKTIGRDIALEEPQLLFARGYDHNFVLTDPSLTEPFLTATGDQSGITLQVATNLPGAQLYTGNFLHQIPGKNGAIYQERSGFCVETQHFPNAINWPDFPSPVLKAHEPCHYESRYRFGLAADTEV